MGLFLSFLGGAAERFTESLQESEKTARAEASLRTKALYENYAEVVKNNRKLESELKADASFLQSLSPNISQDQVSALVFNRPVMDMLKKKIEAGEVNPAELDFATLTGITEQNANPIAATQRIESMFKLPKVAQAVEPPAPKGFFESVSASQRKDAETQMAAALGVSMEELRGAKGFAPTVPDVGARFELTQLMKPKKINDELNNAQMALLDAQKSGNAEAIASAQSYVDMVANAAKNPLTDPQKEFANRVASLKQKATGTDPAAAKEAEKELQKIWALEKREKEAKKTAGEKAAEGKVPALGSLNTITGAAVLGGLYAKYGSQIKDGKIAVTADVNGNVNIVPLVATSEGIELRKQMAADSVRIAQSTLSRYIHNGIPINDEVATVMNRWQAAVQFAGEVPAAQPADQGQQRPARIAPPTGKPSMTPEQIARERQLAADAIKKQPQNETTIKNNFKNRTGQDY